MIIIMKNDNHNSDNNDNTNDNNSNNKLINALNKQEYKLVITFFFKSPTIYISFCFSVLMTIFFSSIVILMGCMSET